MDWVEAIGYERELVHTAALRYILATPAGAAIASALICNGSCVVAVDTPRTEQRLRGRRPIDLAARLTFAEGGGRMLAVETKVDSAWTPDQLRATVPRAAHGVLLAVGYTALAVTDTDLASFDDEYDVPWRRIGPDRFAEIVRAHAGADRDLTSYAGHLEREALDHAAALDAVRAGRAVEFGRAPVALGHWAYFQEAISGRDDIAQWTRKTQVSGPLLTLFPEHLRRFDSGDYLEFMGEGERRSLCVKTYAPAGVGTLARARERLQDLFDDFAGATRPRGRTSANDKTCTAVRWSLEDQLPSEAAALIESVVDRLTTAA